MATFNYFNYFTEIEEYFWRKRGAHILVSPLDWAILETWQKANIPLEVVLQGIDQAFESYSRSRRGAGGRPLKSLAYCVDAVLDAALEAQEAAAGSNPVAGTRARKPAADPFSREEITEYLARNAQKLREAADAIGQQRSVGSSAPDAGHFPRRLADTVVRLEECRARVNSGASLDLEDLERQLTVLEDGIYAALQACAEPEKVLDIRREMDRQLAPYRRKMTAEQLALLEQQYLRRRLFETYALPRLSLFYLG